MEQPTFDRAALGYRSLRGRQLVDSSGEKSLNRRRHSQLSAFLGHGAELLDEQGISLCRLDDSLREIIREPARQAVDELGGIQVGQR